MIIPVRDSRGVSQWDSAMRLLDVTVARALRQHGPTPHVVLVMTRGDRPPESASWPGVTLVEVELPYSELSEGQGKRRWIEIRRDKGARVAAGVLAAAPGGHIMVADWDDLVSPRISQLVADNPEAPGWRAESGFILRHRPHRLRHRTGYAHRQRLNSGDSQRSRWLATWHD